MWYNCKHNLSTQTQERIYWIHDTFICCRIKLCTKLHNAEPYLWHAKSIYFRSTDTLRIQWPFPLHKVGVVSLYMNPLTFGRAPPVKIVCKGNTQASKWLKRQIDYVTQTVRSVAVNNFTQWAGRAKSNPHQACDWIILLTYRLDIVARIHCPWSSSNASMYVQYVWLDTLL